MEIVRSYFFMSDAARFRMVYGKGYLALTCITIGAENLAFIFHFRLYYILPVKMLVGVCTILVVKPDESNHVLFLYLRSFHNGLVCVGVNPPVSSLLMGSYDITAVYDVEILKRGYTSGEQKCNVFLRGKTLTRRIVFAWAIDSDVFQRQWCK